MMTDAALAERIDAPLAVDRALTPAEHTAFRNQVLVGGYAGATPADWIDVAAERDDHLDVIEPWMAQHAARAIAELRERHPLPERLIGSVLIAAIYATIAMSDAPPGAPHRTAVEIAGDALLWARGYAERCGWSPGTRAQTGTCPGGRPGCTVDHHV